jgi:hypothetical protein
MTTTRKLLASALFGVLGVANSATAQEIASYTVVEDRSTYYVVPPTYVETPTYVAPPIVVERRYATEDASISEDVRAALNADPRLDNTRNTIAVDTNRGVVSLSGTVTRPGQATIAKRDAQLIPDVREVNNYLRARIGFTS